jgi:ring-1,2-phenylacetyl-CoA epoxidase subunit PaaA
MDNVQLLERISSGKLVEGPQHATEDYVKSLARTLIVSGDTELISAPSYLIGARSAPRLQSYVSVIGIVQDEIGHAHIAYRMLRDLGFDTDELVYGREPHEFKHPYAFDVPLENWSEMVVANGFYDRAGFVLLSDIFQHTSYGPWKRALVKVDREETFHLRHGERWMKTLAADPGTRDELQRAVEWMFLMTLEWFGLPDELKRHGDQLNLGLKGKSNDELRQVWLSTAVPFCESIGIDVPAHYDDASGKYFIDCAFPQQFDEEEKRWLGEEITWDAVMERWRRRGPLNEQLVEMIQHGHLERLSQAA